MNTTRTASGVAIALLAVTAGCAGNQPISSTAGYDEVQEKIDDAESAEAQRFATRELNAARETLDQAQLAQQEGDEERAARLLQRAALDADYATAVAENEELQTAVQELRDTLATLQEELARGQQQNDEPQQRRF